MSTRKFYNFAVLSIVCISITIGLCGYASAQESVEPPYSYPIALCPDVCTDCIYPSVCDLSPVRVINKDPCIPGSCGSNAAWTSLSTPPTGPGFNLNELICMGIPYVDVCANPIWTVSGESSVAMRNFEAVMYDPGFDSEAKICLSSSGVIGKCSELSGIVQSWTIIVPVTADCPPGAQGGGWDSRPVFGYAKIRLVAVCEEGAGSPCLTELPPNGRPYSAPTGVCASYENMTIIIDQIQCISCTETPVLNILTPYPINFGEVNVGDSSVVQEVRLLNMGGNILHISDVNITGFDTSDFAIQRENCSVRVLPSSSECTIQLVFSPANDGERSATLSITSNDPDNPAFNVSLNGTGIPLIECAVTPEWPVVVQGGTLGLQAFATNNTDEVQIFKYATRITLPNGNKYPNSGYLVGPIEVTLNPHQTKSRHLSQYIPHYAPLGTYTYHGYVGNYGVGIYDECIFTFTVNSQGQGCNLCHQ